MKASSDTFTIAKGIAMLCVVIGHTQLEYLHSFVYLFHLAIFYFVAGYFFNEAYLFKKRVYLIKRLKSLYLPFLKYMLFFLFMHNIFLQLHLYSESPIFSWDGTAERYYQLSDYIKRTYSIIFCFSGVERMGGALWFLRSLFTVSLSYCLISYITNKLKLSEVKCFIVFIIIYVLSFIAISYNLHNWGGIWSSNITLLIFASGKIYYNHRKRIPCNKYLFAFSFTILCLSAYWFKQIEIASLQFVNPFYFIIISLVGCYFVIYLSQIINRTRFIKKTFILIGKHSLAIMALHILAFKLVNLLQITIYSYDIEYLSASPVITENINYWWIIYTVVGTFLPILWIKLTHFNFR